MRFLPLDIISVFLPILLKHHRGISFIIVLNMGIVKPEMISWN